MKVAVIGLGTMGPGMAATLARGGFDVAGFDVDAAKLARAPADAAAAGEVLERIGGRAAPAPGALRWHSELADAVRDADFVVENVPERIELKHAVFAELERLAPPHAILASDTSGIPIGRLQEAVSDKSRVVGMHWSNPPHIIPMIEVIAGPHTAPAVVEATRRLVLDLGLLPVLVERDVPGFVENRVLYAIMRECLALVEQGVIAPEALDTCVRWGIGFKLSVIGPMALLDVAGLDIYQSVAGYLNAELDARKDVPAYVATRTAAGDLGMKTGRGIYDYTPERIAALRAARAALLVGVRRTLEGR
jgi:3-hydroxybutyryl-CoA dehydrogenase/5-formyl-3-hydroxy-2-methylpyridine 4-carboxylate dehydrogenase